MEGCCVCADDSGTEDNPLVYCDGPKCNVCVHKACYGIRSIPTGDWLCSKCVHLRREREEKSTTTATSLSSPLASMSATTATAAAATANGGETAVASNNNDGSTTSIVKCELCPSLEGALKPTESGKWAHVVCALYIKEAMFQDTDVMEPIITSSIPKDRFQQTCYICVEEATAADATSGACAVCEKNGCKKAFHVTCAQKKGLLCEITRKNSKQTVVYSGYCGDHIPSAESGIADGCRYRKIVPYPRNPAATDRASSSSGYSTPNNADKTPPPPALMTEHQQPSANPQITTQEKTVLSESDQPRSSSNKSTASVGSSGTTESADSGVPFSATPESVTNNNVSGNNSNNLSSVAGQPITEERAIRKPPKKSLSARMDGAGSAPVFTPTTMPSSQQSSFPPQGLFNPSSSHSGPSVEQLRYFSNSAYVTPQELQAQYDLSQQQGRPPISHAPVFPVKSLNSAEIPPYLGGSQSKSSNERSTPTSTLPKKRALSPSILDGNETLTISSLIERTIERATTHPSSMPPVSMPFAVGGGPFAPQPPPVMQLQQQETPVAPKKSKRAPKETKVDPRRGGNTATIKDLLAVSGMSPVQMQQQQQSSSSPLTNVHQLESGSKVPTPKPRNENADSSPYSRERTVVSPKSSFMRQQDDRHRHAVEKVQHYLNTGVNAEDRQAAPPAPVPTAAPPKSRRKTHVPEERVNPPNVKHNAQLNIKNADSPPVNQPARINGHANGVGLHDDEQQNLNGPQAFDNFMMAISSAGISSAHQLASSAHPSAATALDGFFRMQKEMELLKRKVGELEGLKAFYLTQVQALRSLTEKHAHDAVYPMTTPSMPEEVARLLMVLGGNGEIPPPNNAALHHPHQHERHGDVSDGLVARLHEPNTGSGGGQQSQNQGSRNERRDASSRPESRVVQNNNVGHYPPNSHGLLQGQSPNSTPKPPSRSRLPKEPEVRDREQSRESRQPDNNAYAHSNGYAPSSTSSHGSNSQSSSQRRPHYPGLEHLEGISSGVISTPAPVVSQPQLLMPNVGAPQFLMQNPQLYSMPLDQRMFSMMPGQFFSPMYQPSLGGFLPGNSSDFTGLGRMHTPTSTPRYSMDDPSMAHQQSTHGNMKREQYEMQQRES